MRPSNLASILFIVLLCACGDKDKDDKKVWEGKNPGECSDGTDNDGDGAYDCDDEDCDGSPDCEDGDGGAEDGGGSQDGGGEGDGGANPDADGDGQTTAQGDCDDTNPDIYDGADEYCNGVDDDCDGRVDEPPVVDGPLWYVDWDGDGFGNDDASIRSCENPSDHDYSDHGGDCDDRDPAANPDASEDCADGIDNNCNGLSDCEEATCEDLYVCDEVSCNNKIDDDDDGLVDCEDDGCWGMPACAEQVSTTALSGDLVAYVKHRWYDGPFGGTSFENLSVQTGFLYLHDIDGTVRARFTDHTQTCSWTLPYGAIYGTQQRKSDGIDYAALYEPVTIDRHSFAVAGDGCTYWGTSVVPPAKDWFIGFRSYALPAGGSTPALIGEWVTTWDSSDFPARISPFYVGTITSVNTTATTAGSSSGLAFTGWFGWIYADVQPFASYTFAP